VGVITGSGAGFLGGETATVSDVGIGLGLGVGDGVGE
jgi:hypothetical protein